MSLSEKIRADLTEAMKARDAERTSTLRMIQSAIKNEQIEKKGELSDGDVLTVLRRAVKQRHDSIEQYEKGNRKDLADKERSELAILEKYLPQQMSDEDAERLVRELIASTGATSKKDSGKVMKELMAKHRGVIDGKKAQEILGRLLP